MVEEGDKARPTPSGTRGGNRRERSCKNAFSPLGLGEGEQLAGRQRERGAQRKAKELSGTFIFEPSRLHLSHGNPP